MREEEYIVFGRYTDFYTQLAINTITFYGKKHKLIEMGSEESQKYIKKLSTDIIPQIFYYDPVRTYGREDMEVHIGSFEELYRWFNHLQGYK